MFYRKIRTKVFFLALVFLTSFLFPPFFLSCSSHSEGSSFISKLDEIDAYISAGDAEDAADLLKKVSKHSYSPQSILGLYRRAMRLGDEEFAEKLLSKGIKKNPKSEELRGVYSNFLLRRGRTDKALEVSFPLSGGKYGSFYSEALLTLALEKKENLSLSSSAENLFEENTSKNVKKNQKKKIKEKSKKKNSRLTDQEKEELEKKENEVFFDSRFEKIYTDAFNTSKNTSWLKNAALIYIKNSDFSSASSLYLEAEKKALLKTEFPSPSSSLEDSLFWSYVLYDSGLFAESLESLSSSSEKVSTSSFSEKKDSLLVLEKALLKADLLYILGEDEKSQDERNLALNMKFDESDWYSPRFYALYPLLLSNSALYFKNLNQLSQEYKAIEQLVNLYPQYVPGLALHVQFALEVLKRPPEEKDLALLRSSGLKTLAMEMEDEKPGIDISDSAKKIADALEIEKNPSLLVLREELTDALYQDQQSGVKNGRVWQLLEENEISSRLYPPEIVRYALSVLIENGEIDSASSLLDSFIDAEKKENLSAWELEDKAYLALMKKQVASGKEYYEKLIDSYASRSPLLNESCQNKSLINAYVNLACLASYYGDNDKALEYLNMALSRTGEPYLRSDILYRMAECSYGRGDEKSALRSLQYAIQLDGKNNKARLMLKKLRK